MLIPALVYEWALEKGPPRPLLVTVESFVNVTLTALDTAAPRDTVMAYVPAARPAG
jgi:hypothetical protein